MSGQLDLQLSRILDRRKLAVEEPGKYGSTPFRTSRSSLSTTRSEMSNLRALALVPTAARNSAAMRQPPANPQLPRSVTSNKGKLKLETIKLETVTKLEEVCQDSIRGRFPRPIGRRVVRPSADSPLSSSFCSSEQYGKTLQKKFGGQLSLDEMCQEKALPDSPISSSRCGSEQYGEVPQFFYINDEKDGGGTEEWNSVRLKTALKLNLDKVCQDSMSGQVTLSADSPISSSRFSSEQYGENPRLFWFDDGSTEGTPSPSRVPRLSLSGLDEGGELERLVAQHQERQVAAGVSVLQAGQPTLSTQLLAAAEDARRWLISFPSLCAAVETTTEVAAQRTPRAASDVAKAASQWILGELRESRVAVTAFSRPEVLLLEAPASHCPTTPRESLDCIMTALQRGRPSVTVRAMARAEHARQSVLYAWKVAEQLGRDLFTSRMACTIAQKMEDCAAIADVYELKNPRILSDEHVEQD